MSFTPLHSFLLRDDTGATHRWGKQGMGEAMGAFFFFFLCALKKEKRNFAKHGKKRKKK